MYQIQSEKFEGPLPLLLTLIEKKEFNISDISLASVADDYIEYVEKSDTISTEELSDFLMVAARLILMKAKTLIQEMEDEEAESGSLTDQLRLYKEFVTASERLEGMFQKRLFQYPREKSTHAEPIFLPPAQVEKQTLQSLFEGVIQSIEVLVRLPEKILEKVFSLQEKVDYLKNLLLARQSVQWKEILTMTENPTEVVVSFLALLELMRHQEVHVRQEALFADIHIKWKERVQESKE